MLNYFENENYISNSELGEFDRMFSGREEMSAERKQLAYDFGNLFEQTAGVDSYVESFANKFDAATLEKARLMDLALKNDPSFGHVFNHMKTQHEIYLDDFEIDCHGDIINLPVKCKLDGYNERMKLVVDLKSTVATSQVQFDNAMKHFKYLRQGAWYMDLPRVDRVLFIGVSKKEVRGRHQVFYFPIVRGDVNYLTGKAQYSYIAHRYYYYIHLLKL